MHCTRTDLTNIHIVFGSNYDSLRPVLCYQHEGASRTRNVSAAGPGKDMLPTEFLIIWIPNPTATGHAVPEAIEPTISNLIRRRG